MRRRRPQTKARRQQVSCDGASTRAMPPLLPAATFLTAGSGRADGGAFGIGSFRTPLDFVFYFSIVNSVFAVLGFAGVINGQRELVTGFFVYNAVQMVRLSYAPVDLARVATAGAFS